MAPLASLPMYDWPEVRPALDALWTAIADKLRAAGINPPDGLDHQIPEQESWLREDLLLGQSCGLPYARRLMNRVHLLGSLAFDLADCPAGDYCSRIVVARNDKADDLAHMRGSVLAYNSDQSQSGYNAVMGAIAAHAPQQAFLGGRLETGAHREAIRAVANGRARFAAIDAVTWRLALDHEPAAAELRVLASTPPTPGLPLISARAEWRDVLVGIMPEALGSLAPWAARDLHLMGFVPRRPVDYACFGNTTPQ